MTDASQVLGSIIQWIDEQQPIQKKENWNEKVARSMQWSEFCRHNVGKERSEKKRNKTDRRASTIEMSSS